MEVDSLSLRREVVLLAFLALLFAAVPAKAVGEPTHHAVNLSFLYPISTNKNPDISTSFQLAILEGRVGEIRAFALNGGVSLIGRDLHGIQITGLYSEVNGQVHALQLTGGINYNRSGTRGLILAGLANLSRGSVSGIQIGGFFNSTGDRLSGMQVASAYNFVQGDGGRLQISGVANTVGGDYKGLQATFGYNMVLGHMHGIQFGGVNMALDLRGAQLGLLNLARDSHGLQVGVLNRYRNQNGLPIGMVNVGGNTSVEGLAYWHSLTGANLGVRTTVKRFYSMLTAGAPDQFEGDVPQTLTLNWNYGYQVVSGEKTHVGLDLGFSHYIPWEFDEPGENSDLHFGLQARGLVDRKLNSNISAFVGVGAGWVYPGYSLGDSPEAEEIIFGGLALR